MDGSHNLSNVLLVLMVLDRDDRSPLRIRSGELESDGAHLLAGVLDPAHRAANAPVTAIELDPNMRRTYNQVLLDFQEISAKFYEEGGFIEKPESYTPERQAEILKALSGLGLLIYELFPTGNPVRGWLEKLLRFEGERPIQPVTIITNDFNVPWFWLKKSLMGPFLCEVCSLGVLQLFAAGGGEGYGAQSGRQDGQYEALLIKGSTGLPFLDEEFNAIGTVLEGSHRKASRTFKVHYAASRDEIIRLGMRDTEYLRSSFRVVHLGGCYSGEILNMGTMAPILNSSLLVLDGYSNPILSDGWSDLKGLVSKVMNVGSLGCVLNVLPVKHDPIASRVLWETFYRPLQLGTLTVGQALANARKELRAHFNDIGSPNPMWAAYQLIGSPAVQLCYEDTDANG